MSDDEYSLAKGLGAYMAICIYCKGRGVINLSSVIAAEETCKACRGTGRGDVTFLQQLYDKMSVEDKKEFWTYLKLGVVWRSRDRVSPTRPNYHAAGFIDKVFELAAKYNCDLEEYS